jgi:hypothetical protein
MRQIDKVLVKGSSTAMDMYTFDAFQEQEMVGKGDKKAWGAQGFDQYTKRMSEDYDADTSTIFEDDPDLVRLRRHVAFHDESNLSMSSLEDPCSPVRTWLKKQRISLKSIDGYDAPHASDASDVEINEDSINIPRLHGKG